jgi:hypothetical protein
MRWAEYTIYFLLSIGVGFLAAGLVRKNWSTRAKFFFKYVVPVLIFVLLSFDYVVTGERIEDTVAKGIFCWVYEFQACRKEKPAEVTSLDSTAAQIHSPAELFEIRNLSNIPLTKENCIEAGKQADRYFNANNRVRMRELLEISLALCSHVPVKDQEVNERLAGSYVALGSQLGRGSADACRYYGEARRLYSELSQANNVTQIEFMRKVDNCP